MKDSHDEYQFKTTLDWIIFASLTVFLFLKFLL